MFSLARWHRAGVHFHPLFQFQLMGLNGAFLTGDLFNLFVFFEVMLAASYGLLLHGSGARARAAPACTTSRSTCWPRSLFLIGVGLIYGVTGTLNMADLAQRIAADRRRTTAALLHAGAAILGVAFLVKAGDVAAQLLAADRPMPRPAPPVAALFAILTKVGVYAVLRLWLLLFGEGAGHSAGFGGAWLLFGGLLTIAFGAIGGAGVAEHGAAGRRQRAGLVGHAARGDRLRAGRGDRRRALLPGQLRPRRSPPSSCWSSWSSAAARSARTCWP